MAKKRYKMPDWAVNQIHRENGVVEDICAHGVGHPNQEWLKELFPKTADACSVHGCDGCCCNRSTNEKDPKPEIAKWEENKPNYIAEFTFCQTGDSCQSNPHAYQHLKVILEASGSGHFLRITTGKEGWAVDSPEEFMEILKFVQRVQSDNEQISGAPHNGSNS